MPDGDLGDIVLIAVDKVRPFLGGIEQALAIENPGG